MAVTKINVDKIVLRLALAVEDKATKEGRIPVLSRDLKNSIKTFLRSKGVAVVGSNLPYARAVHDGRPRITFGPNVSKNPPLGRRKHRNKKRARLKFKIGGVTVFARQVTQKARKGKPFFREAINELNAEGYGFVLDPLAKEYGDDLVRDLKRTTRIQIRF